MTGVCERVLGKFCRMCKQKYAGTSRQSRIAISNDSSTDVLNPTATVADLWQWALDTPRYCVVIYFTHYAANPPTRSRSEGRCLTRRWGAQPACRPGHRCRICDTRVFRSPRPRPGQIRDDPPRRSRGPARRDHRRGVPLLAPVVLPGAARVSTAWRGRSVATEARASGRPQAHRRHHGLSPRRTSARAVRPAHGASSPCRRPIRDPRASAQCRAGARATGKKTAVEGPQSPCVVPHGAVDDYEGLRRAVLEGTHGDRDLGRALLIRRGMAAWIRAWSTCGAPASSERRPDAEGLPLPAGLRGDVTRLLVTMALTTTRPEAHA